MAAKKKNASVGDKVKSILKNTAKQTGKDLLMLGTIVGPGKAVKGASMVAKARAGQQVSSKVANARGLKAANKPTNKVGSKADKALRSRAKSVSMSKEQAVKSYDAMYGKGVGKNITQINKRVVPKNEARSVRQLPKKKSK